MSQSMIIQGGCHCGKVRFEIETPEEVEVDRCNCSICSKSGYLHLILPLQKFKLLKGNESLSSYRFNSGIAEHRFCSHCGIKPFYIPRSNPDGIDINLNCLDQQPRKVVMVEFDGANWEQNAYKVAHKSKLT